MPSLPWAHSYLETIWEESGSYMLRFKNFMTYILWNWEVYHGPTCLRAQRIRHYQGLNMRTYWGLKRTFKCWSRLTPYMRWVHSLHERHDISQQIPATRVPGLGKSPSRKYLSYAQGYLVADGLWASICICKNSRIFFHSEHWEIRQRVNSE